MDYGIVIEIDDERMPTQFSTRTEWEDLIDTIHGKVTLLAKKMISVLREYEEVVSRQEDTAISQRAIVNVSKDAAVYLKALKALLKLSDKFSPSIYWVPTGRFLQLVRGVSAIVGGASSVTFLSTGEETSEKDASIRIACLGWFLTAAFTGALEFSNKYLSERNNVQLKAEVVKEDIQLLELFQKSTDAIRAQMNARKLKKMNRRKQIELQRNLADSHSSSEEEDVPESFV